jgi:hypothetical protein
LKPENQFILLQYGEANQEQLSSQRLLDFKLGLYQGRPLDGLSFFEMGNGLTRSWRRAMRLQG